MTKPESNDWLADIGDLVEVKTSINDSQWKGQGVVFGINPLTGQAQVHWIDENCGFTVHWSRENLTVVRRCPLWHWRESKVG